MNLNLNPDGTSKYEKQFGLFIENLRRHGEQVYYKKDEVVFSEGGKANFMLILEKGILRTYRLVNDKEIVLGFTFPGDLDTSPISFLTSIPSQDTIDAVCESSGIKISRELFFQQLKTLNYSKDILQPILLEYIDVLIKRHLELKAYTAEENYINLLMRQPKLVNEIPLKDVASFLGISKERLSRIRKKHELT